MALSEEEAAYSAQPLVFCDPRAMSALPPGKRHQMRQYGISAKGQKRTSPAYCVATFSASESFQTLSKNSFFGP